MKMRGADCSGKERKKKWTREAARRSAAMTGAVQGGNGGEEAAATRRRRRGASGSQQEGARVLRRTWAVTHGCSLPSSGSLIAFLLSVKSQVPSEAVEVLLEAGDFVGWASFFVADFRSAQVTPAYNFVGSSTCQRWLPPASSCIKLNSDAASNLRLNRDGHGVVFRDYAGLELAVEAGFAGIVVESDSLILVNAVNSTLFPFSEVRKSGVNLCIDVGINHVENAQRLALSRRPFTLSFVKAQVLPS
ncbi:hypothetical protein JRO89_XS13G0232400 [Xanthoceras sorbifolium]|uniref:RNase H type-1 domain-containing protein n=1 Tax=Xanthoceras sorbifolium TaxID=99658 RepID=A0ABQ8H9M5_9ROSI|nr:hypothetical protein JRO89_XS13G0232400 [Xanthoceras sorbifolium]